VHLVGYLKKNPRAADTEYLCCCELKQNKPGHDKMIIPEAERRGEVVAGSNPYE